MTGFIRTCNRDPRSTKNPRVPFRSFCGAICDLPPALGALRALRTLCMTGAFSLTEKSIPTPFGAGLRTLRLDDAKFRSLALVGAKLAGCGQLLELSLEHNDWLQVNLLSSVCYLVSVKRVGVVQWESCCWSMGQRLPAIHHA